MHEYHLDLNSLAQRPIVLYTTPAPVTQINDWDEENGWACLFENQKAPVESLILRISKGESLRLGLKIDRAREAGIIPERLLEKTRADFAATMVYLMEDILIKGVHDAEDLRRVLVRHKKHVGLAHDGYSHLTFELIIPADAPALTILQQQVAKQTPVDEIIKTINQKNLTWYFDPGCKKLPGNFDPERIRHVVTKDIPARRAYTKFIEELLHDYDECHEAALKKLADPIYRQKSNYQRFPGIRPGKCWAVPWAAQNGLKVINLTEAFNHQTIAKKLAEYPDGFIALANGSREERIVFPDSSCILVKPQAELFAPQPEETELQEIFSSKDPAVNTETLLELFEALLKPQIDHALKDSDQFLRAGIWIILCRESLDKILASAPPARLEKINLRKKLETIAVYLKKARQKIPNKVYAQSRQQRLEARRQLNIKKSLATLQELKLDLTATRDNPKHSLTEEDAHLTQFIALNAARKKIMQEQKELERKLGAGTNSLSN